MRNILAMSCVILCVVGTSLFAQDGSVSFRTLTSEETGIRPIMEKWHDAELARQGGKFGSHGWWLWGLNAFDFDGDGDLDLMPTHHGAPGGLILKSLLKETGKLTFVEATPEVAGDGRNLPGADGKPWIWDFDGDGWLDIAGWSDESKPMSLFNLGGKRFEKIPDFTFNPISHAGEVLDLNGDGYLDVRANLRGALWECLYDPKARTFAKHNRGPVSLDHVPAHVRGFFDEVKKRPNNRFFGVGYVTEHDLNGDGRTDLIAAGSGAYGGDILARYYLADAQGDLVDATKALGLPEKGTPILITDLTGDGLADVVVAVGDEAGLYVNSGKGTFALANNSLVAFLKKGGPYLLRAWPVDFDCDGDMDLVVSNPRYGAEEIHENLGGGSFRRVLAARGWDSDPIAIGDIDGDGLPDVVAQSENVVHLFWNAGGGRFEHELIAKPPALCWRSRPIAVADLNGDGRLDIVGAAIHRDGRLPQDVAAVWWLEQGLTGWVAHVIKWGSGFLGLGTFNGEKWDQLLHTTARMDRRRFISSTLATRSRSPSPSTSRGRR